MSKRFQIPTTSADFKLFQNIAKKEGLSTAEWARRLLKKEVARHFKNRTWDDLFKSLGESPPSEELKLPKRKNPRKVPSGDSWG